MPTVFRHGPYRFMFYSSDHPEPVHIHAIRDSDTAKFWLDPVSLSENHGFKNHELNHIEQIVVQNKQQLLEAWRDFFDSKV